MAKRKTHVAELEIPEQDTETTELVDTETETAVYKCENCGTPIPNGAPAHLDEDGVALCEECWQKLPKVETASSETDTAQTEVPPPELTQEEKIAAYIRKEQVLREAQSDLNSLEDQQADARREMNSFKKPISEARAKVERLISCDVSGFLRWEKEQELPLIQKAEEAANAWKELPVESLDVTAKDKEKLAEHFTTCGNVADWLGKDFADKKTGLNGEKTKDRLQVAINKISGNMEA